MTPSKPKASRGSRTASGRAGTPSRRRRRRRPRPTTVGKPPTRERRVERPEGTVRRTDRRPQAALLEQRDGRPVGEYGQRTVDQIRHHRRPDRSAARRASGLVQGELLPVREDGLGEVPRCEHLTGRRGAEVDALRPHGRELRAGSQTPAGVRTAAMTSPVRVAPIPRSGSPPGSHDRAVGHQRKLGASDAIRRDRLGRRPGAGHARGEANLRPQVLRGKRAGPRGDTRDHRGRSPAAGRSLPRPSRPHARSRRPPGGTPPAGGRARRGVASRARSRPRRRGR